MKFRNTALAIAIIGIVACKKDSENSQVKNPSFNGDINTLVAPEGFSFNTIVESQALISVSDLEDMPIEGVSIDFFTADPENGGEIISSARTGANGLSQSNLRIPTYLNEIFVKVNYPGFANTALVNVNENINLNFGGSPEFNKNKGKSAGTQSRIPLSGNYYYMGTFDSEGVPDYLITPDVIQVGFLNDVASSFPESQPVPTNNPEYLATGNQLSIDITAKSDVWVTFLSEGAGFKNTLFYYKHPTGSAPATSSAIDSIFIIFPNTSFAGSGGGLNAGDKVWLGVFEPGITISWGLISSGWNGSGVNVSQTHFYSEPTFNTNETSAYQQHNVQLIDQSRELILNGFEDKVRSNGGSDEDFNDLLFYVSANPWTAIDPTNFPEVTSDDDDDDDGVDDIYDEYPDDPDRAYTNNYTGTLAFEDLWPYTGDYDFNDLVIDYDITEVLNASNEVVDVLSDWSIQAIGASFKNGFGYTFENIAGSAIASITGQELQEGIVVNNSNGAEQGQTNATVIVFDNATAQMPKAGTAFINTVPGDPSVSPYTYSVNVTFSTPQNQADLGTAPYNPFIIKDGNRDVEIHLADNKNTDLADVALFGTAQDDTDPSSNKYYKTANNLPWALHIQGGFDYPVEYSPITDAYNNFANWAMSGGASFTDWYLDTPGNRNSADVY